VDHAVECGIAEIHDSAAFYRIQAAEGFDTASHGGQIDLRDAHRDTILVDNRPARGGEV
jgi:hypothetical protein